MATLLVYRGDALIERIPIGAHDLRIGRQAENDIVLPDDGKAVSRYHAELRNENGKHVIYDLNSQNGTWVEASRVNRATLAIGQEAVIGPYRIRVSAEDLQQEEEAARPTMEAPAPAVTRPATRGSTAAVPPTSSSGTRSAAATSTGPMVSTNAVLYGAAGVATLLVVAAAVWMLQAPRPESVQTQSTTTTTILPEPPKADPDMERLQAAMQLVEEGAFAEAVTSHLEPLLAANPAHEQAGLLWTRAQIALAPPPVPRASVPAPAAVAKPLEPGIERLSGESDAAYLNRVEDARSQYDYGDKMLGQSDWATARQFFERLAATYPGFRDAGAKAQLARDRIEEAAKAAMAAGRKLEDEGQFPAAVKEYMRAQTLGADAGEDIARANTTARTTAEGLMKQARVFENSAARGSGSSRDEAVKRFRRIIELLPEGDPTRVDAESRLLKLAP